MKISRSDINTLAKALAEIDRLNKWADSFSDAQLKERQLCEDRIKELEKLRNNATKRAEKAEETLRQQGFGLWI